MNNYRWCKLYENMVIVLKIFKTLVDIILMTQPYYNSFKVHNTVFFLMYPNVNVMLLKLFEIS